MAAPLGHAGLAVLRDQDEGGEEDRLERDDEREEIERERIERLEAAQRRVFQASQTANQTRCTQRKLIEPQKPLIASATRSPRLRCFCEEASSSTMVCTLRAVSSSTVFGSW